MGLKRTKTAENDQSKPKPKSLFKLVNVLIGVLILIVVILVYFNSIHKHNRSQDISNVSKFTNDAYIYEEKSQYNQAAIYFSQAYSKAVNNTAKQALADSTAQAYEASKNYSSAESWYYKALNVDKDLKNNTLLNEDKQSLKQVEDESNFSTNSEIKK